MNSALRFSPENFLQKLRKTKRTPSNRHSFDYIGILYLFIYLFTSHVTTVINIHVINRRMGVLVVAK